MKYNFEKIIAKTHHTLRKNCLRLSKNYTYIPKYLFKVKPLTIDVHIDKENKAIMIMPSEDGYKITEYNAYIFNSRVLARVMPHGNYKLDNKNSEDNKLIFVLVDRTKEN